MNHLAGYRLYGQDTAMPQISFASEGGLVRLCPTCLLEVDTLMNY